MKHLRDVPVEGYKSCLPTYIATSNEPVASNSEHRRHKTSHLPRPIRNSTMERTVTVPRSYSPDLDVALRLYDRLRGLTGPWCAAGRMKLPCIAFRTPPFSPYRTRSDRTHRADTLTFGMVEVKTRDNLSQMNVLYLVHPCLSALLERGDTKSVYSFRMISRYRPHRTQTRPRYFLNRHHYPLPCVRFQWTEKRKHDSSLPVLDSRSGHYCSP
ncbi:hypothetical protein EV363DRAFT_434484 [Boletus edulis]|nr:hypothetical protein EV363DRAFT_434484 [Boletus edulis]